MKQDNKQYWLKKVASLLGAMASLIGIVAFILSRVYPHNDIRAFQREIESGDADGAIEIYQKVNPRSHLYGLAIQDFPAHSQPIYTTLTPKSTTWSPDNKSQVGPVLPV